MSSLLLKNAGAVIGTEISYGVSIAVSEISIAAIGPGAENYGGDVLDCSGLTILPGFIDVHIHGARGVDVNAAHPDGLIEIARFLATQGVTSWMPTLVPDSDANYGRIISAIDRLIELQAGEPVAQAIGVHYEGVFANEQMCGALRPQYFKKFTGPELASLTRPIVGLCMMTFAPEVEGGVELAKELSRRGWIASIGHTKADTETLDAAFAAGATHVTHFFNAMTGMHHRDVGVVGWALANDDVTFDIIADGIHVHPRMLRVACRAKSPDRVTLISDSVAPTGMGDGEFKIWGETVTVEGGQTRNERGSIAGSVISMLDAVRRMHALGFSWPEVAGMASHNPARLLGVDGTLGTIEVGKRADLVGLDTDGNVKLAIVAGRTAVNHL